jgi:hypothetical protein
VCATQTGQCRQADPRRKDGRDDDQRFSYSVFINVPLLADVSRQNAPPETLGSTL